MANDIKKRFDLELKEGLVHLASDKLAKPSDPRNKISHAYRHNGQVITAEIRIDIPIDETAMQMLVDARPLAGHEDLLASVMMSAVLGASAMFTDNMAKALEVAAKYHEKATTEVMAIIEARARMMADELGEEE